MKYIKYTSWLLGSSMFMFGVLKFVNPFKTWYASQVSHSHLGDAAYFLGIAGEIAVGLLYILSLLNWDRLQNRRFYSLQALASGVTTIMMLTAFYVHIHPEVPSDVLPLKIKPPVIPVIFMLMAIGNLFYSIKLRNQSH